MPEDTKMAVDNDSLPKTKSTGNVRSSGNVLAQVTMLDGSVLDINIEVNIILKQTQKRFRETISVLRGCFDKYSY